MKIHAIRARLAALLPRSPNRRIAAAWSVGVFLVAAATAPAVGISRDESVYVEAAEGYARFWSQAVRSPGQVLPLADRYYAANHEHPGFAKGVYAITHALLASGLGVTSHLQGFRFGAFLFAALLAGVLSLWGSALAGHWGGGLAPAFFFLVPAHFYHSHPAVLDLPETALWLATAYAYWRSIGGGGDQPRSGRWAVAAGLLFGATVATKHNGWFLLPLLFGCWFLSALPALLREGPRALAARFPLAFLSMAIFGPMVFLATWPWLWAHPLSRFRDYLAFHLHHENYAWMYFGSLLREPPFPVSYPFLVTVLTVPAGLLAAMCGGLLQSVARIVRALRGAIEDVSLPTEVLLSANSLFPLSLIAWPTVPHFGGTKHWMAAMPFLALLGARAVVITGRTLLPRRPVVVTGALAALALAPAAWQVIHVHPFGTAAWNELAGGAAGAASMGMQRQFWGDNMGRVLAALNEHAAPNARVWFQEATWLAVKEYQRDGRLRRDLVWATGPEDAEISVWHYHQEFRDKEFRTWTEFRSARPVAGVYLDEVPLIQVYARAGAWR